MKKALDIDADSVDAFVGQGAIYANKHSYVMAVESFSKALEIEPRHRNARKYLLEVLVAQGKSVESKSSCAENLWKARKLYEKALRLDGGDKPAREALNALRVFMRREE